MNRINLIKERMALDAETEEENDCECESERDSGVSSDLLPELDTYCTRSERDAVISGPLGENKKGGGRWFNTPVEALHWAVDKYGEGRVSLILGPEGASRWAVLVKNLRI